MSEDEPSRESGHEPHGVVETLREEIEEVVEHVPRPVQIGRASCRERV